MVGKMFVFFWQRIFGFFLSFCWWSVFGLMTAALWAECTSIPVNMSKWTAFDCSFGFCNQHVNQSCVWPTGRPTGCLAKYLMQWVGVLFSHNSRQSVSSSTFKSSSCCCRFAPHFICYRFVMTKPGLAWWSLKVCSLVLVLLRLFRCFLFLFNLWSLFIAFQFFGSSFFLFLINVNFLVIYFWFFFLLRFFISLKCVLIEQFIKRFSLLKCFFFCFVLATKYSITLGNLSSWQSVLNWFWRRKSINLLTQANNKYCCNTE